MNLLASLCVLCECAVDERANGGDGGWLGERRTQLVIQRAVLGHERVAVFLEESDECLLQGEQRGRVRTPEELETAMAVLFDDRVRFGHGVLDTALEQLQRLLAVLGLVLQERGKVQVSEHPLSQIATAHISFFGAYFGLYTSTILGPA